MNSTAFELRLRAFRVAAARYLVVPLLCFTLLTSPLAAALEPEVSPADLNCREAVFLPLPPTEQSVLDPLLAADAARVIELAKNTCPNAATCSEGELEQIVQVAVAKSPSRSRRALKSLMRLSRRSLVFLIWTASALGPGVLSYFLTAGVPDGIRIPFSGFVMMMSGVLFGRFSAPFEKKLGPKVEQFAFWLFDPDETDGWGQIMKSLNESNRLENSQIYNQIITLRPLYKSAAQAMNAGELGLAAAWYLVSILHSVDMFGGLNLAHRSTLRDVRSMLLPKTVGEIPLAAKAELIRHALGLLTQVPRDELPENVSATKLREIVTGAFSYWFGIDRASLESLGIH